MTAKCDAVSGMGFYNRKRRLVKTKETGITYGL